MATAFGSGAMSNSMDDIVASAEAILIIGSNTTQQHPVFGAQLRQAVCPVGDHQGDPPGRPLVSQHHPLELLAPGLVEVVDPLVRQLGVELGHRGVAEGLEAPHLLLLAPSIEQHRVTWLDGTQPDLG